MARLFNYIMLLDKNYKFINIFSDITEASDFCKCAQKEIEAAILNHECTRIGYFVESLVGLDDVVEAKTFDKWPVIQINKLGLIENVHKTLAEASYNYGQNIYLCARGVRRYASGFYWKTISDKFTITNFLIDKINRFVLHKEKLKYKLYRDIKTAAYDNCVTENEIYDAIFTPCEYSSSEWSYIRTTLDFEIAKESNLDDLYAENSLMQISPFDKPQCLVGNYIKKDIFLKESDNDVLMVSNDDNYNILGTFKNVHQAELETTFKNIWPCVKKKNGYKTSGGFRWMYRKDYTKLIKRLEDELF